MAMELVGKSEPVEAAFRRVDGHHLKLGVIVSYRLPGFAFMIVAHRDGVDMNGEFPTVNRIGITALKQALDRAVKHHEHLKSFPLGEKQIPLDEITLKQEEMIEHLGTPQ